MNGFQKSPAQTSKKPKPTKISPRCEQSNVGGQRGKLSLTLVGLATVDAKVPFGFTFSSAIFGPSDQVNRTR